MGNNIPKLKRGEIHKHYEFKEVLGSGSFAIVKRCIRRDDKKQFAVKCIKKSKLGADDLAIVHDEVEIMRKINHLHCVRLYDVYNTNKKLYLLIELLTGGELFDRIVSKGSFSELEASYVMRDVVSAIGYLHSIGVVHRDLKPENLLYLNEDQKSPVKLTDFGLAKYKGSESDAKMSTACGTPGYVAPEILQEKRYGKEVDMWSIGVILYILLCGYPPFYAENNEDLYTIIKNGDYDFPDPYWTEISSAAKDLIRKLLQVNPKKRLTAVQVLEHPWISGNAAPSRAFGGGHTQHLKLLQARKKFRHAVRTIIALNRFTLNFDEQKKN